MELTIKEFNKLNLVSNKNLHNIIEEIIGETQNCALINMFSDKIILYDTLDEEFYMADWNFDVKKSGILRIGNYEKININKETQELNESITEYFNGNIDSSILAAKIFENSGDVDKEFSSLINEGVHSKNYCGIDYDLLMESKNELKSKKLDLIKESNWFKDINNFLWNNPLDSLKYVNFNIPISVNLYESTDETLAKLSNKKYGIDLWKNKNFRTKLQNSVKVWSENVEKTELLTEVFNAYNDFWKLSENEKRETLGKSLVMENVVLKDYDKTEIVDGILKVIDKYNLNPLSEDTEETVENEFDFSIPNTDEVEKIQEALQELQEKCKDDVEVVDYIKTLSESLKENSSNKRTLVELVNILA